MVSVCMATYNGEKYVAEQLRSILMQLQPDDEVIISDDGSTDNTCAIIESFHDERIHLVHSQAHYHKWNFQNALQHAKGDIIFLADQDDVWLNNKYQIGVEALQKYNLVAMNSTLTDEYLQPIQHSFFAYYHSGTGIFKNSVLCTYFGSHMAFRRTLLDLALPFPKPKCVLFDGWLGVLAEITGKTCFIEDITMYYRRHDNSATVVTPNALTRSKRNFFAKLWDRVIVLKYVLTFYIQYRYGRNTHK